MNIVRFEKGWAKYPVIGIFPESISSNSSVFLFRVLTEWNMNGFRPDLSSFAVRIVRNWQLTLT